LLMLVGLFDQLAAADCLYEEAWDCQL
jgi:hypothetical protein